MIGTSINLMHLKESTNLTETTETRAMTISREIVDCDDSTDLSMVAALTSAFVLMTLKLAALSIRSNSLYSWIAAIQSIAYQSIQLSQMFHVGAVLFVASVSRSPKLLRQDRSKLGCL